ncbi:ThuA domain-containing protein [Formosa sp. S-31]|uniref:ThuA domain-containing protein n=1 Tax=Formosa sp. S-31 TaxID=2790949 RepID=UPI003EBB85C7
MTHFWIAIISLSTLFCSGQNNPSIKAAVFTGGKNFERDAFVNALNSLNHIKTEEFFHPEGLINFKDPKLDGFDVLIFYHVSQTISEDQKQALLNLFKAGKPMLFLHHALVCYQDWPEYENIVGGRYYHARKDKDSSLIIPSTYIHDQQIPVHITNPSHPVTQGLQDFVILDEVYNLYKIQPDVSPLLQTSHLDSKPIIAWNHTYKNSPIVYLQLGHNHTAYNDTNYRTLLENAITFLAKQP